MPCIDNICHNIYRWERGTVGLTERYKLYYCVAFGISADEFGAGPSEQTRYLPAFHRANWRSLTWCRSHGPVAGVPAAMTITRNAGGGNGIAGIEAGRR